MNSNPGPSRFHSFSLFFILIRSDSPTAWDRIFDGACIFCYVPPLLARGFFSSDKLVVGGENTYSVAMPDSKPTVVIHNGGGTTKDTETSSSAQQGGYHT
ncbi:hypothetical protein Vi05172_g5628 [Venturia inaequalis]|nr:hypothetical protein Vi05172_g5628 [Venturia inaequalis]